MKNYDFLFRYDKDHLVDLCALSWKPIKTERIKVRSKRMLKLLNKMGPESLKNTFTLVNAMTNYEFRDLKGFVLKRCLPTRGKVEKVSEQENLKDGSLSLTKYLTLFVANFTYVSSLHSMLLSNPHTCFAFSITT